MAHGPTRILIADDEVKICQFLATLLKRDGHDVVTCTSGADALSRLQSGTYSLVITDLKMPGMDGFELIRRIREIDDEMPIVVVTGYATIETAIQALRQGVEDYITKPFNIQDLRRVVKRALTQAELASANRGLVERLERLEAELQYHRGLLQSHARLADAELREANAALRQRVRELTVVHDLDEATAAALTVEDVLNRAVDSMLRRFEARRCSVMLRQDHMLTVRACDEARRGQLLGKEQRLGLGIAGLVARDEEPLLVADLGSHGTLGPLARGGYDTSSFISAAIRHEGVVSGVVNVADKRNGEAFTSNDIKALCGATPHLGAALARAGKVGAFQNLALAGLAELANSLEAKDPYLHGHSERVAARAGELAEVLGLSAGERDDLVRAAHVHDLGKYGIADAILHKASRLTSEEFDQIRNHPAISQHLVEACQAGEPMARTVRHHHERIDGAGYPDHISGGEIPILARILSVADAFDAMTSTRPYRPGLRAEDACQELLAQSGKQFDAEIAAAFCRQVVLKGSA